MRRLLILLLMLAAPFLLSAQNTNWDKVLDEYEHICNECIIIRTQIAQGKDVSDASVTVIVRRLSSLRSSLQASSGSMTKNQVQRFNKIRDRYSAVMGTFSPSTTDAENPEVKQQNGSKSSRQEKTVSKKKDDSKIAAASIGSQVVEAKDSITQEGKAFLNLLEDETAKTSLSIETAGLIKTEGQQPALTASDIGTDPVETQVLEEGRASLDYFILASMEMGRKTSFGALLAVRKGRLGGFILGRSNFSKTAQPIGQIQSDGTMLSGSGPFIASGKSAYKTWSIALGPVVSITDWLSLYAGLGYGKKRLSWQDISGNWMEVEDFSHKGLVVEAGVILYYKHLSFGVGLGYLGEMDATLSLGVRF